MTSIDDIMSIDDEIVSTLDLVHRTYVRVKEIIGSEDYSRMPDAFDELHRLSEAFQRLHGCTCDDTDDVGCCNGAGYDTSETHYEPGIPCGCTCHQILWVTRLRGNPFRSRGAEPR